MIKLTIDGKNISTDNDTTILNAALLAGIDIPTLCYCDNIPPAVSCFICVVKIRGQNNFVPACATKALDEMVVDASSEEVRKCRKHAIELLYSQTCCHPCGCAKKGVCRLKVYTEEYAADPARYAAGPRKDKSLVRYKSGLVHTPGRCIVCGKCVNITKARNVKPGLSLIGRGAEVRVSAPFETPFDAAMGEAMDECVRECPTGALWMQPYGHSRTDPPNLSVAF